MANVEHFNILKRGQEEWNAWRKENPYPGTTPDLSEAELPPGFDLSKFDLSRAYLRGVIFNGVNLRGSILWKADLAKAKLNKAIFRGANLRKANLFEAELNNTELQGANLTGTLFVNTQLNGADLTGSFVYGCSVWETELKGAIQKNLILVDAPGNGYWEPFKLKEAEITVDDLEVAQLIYLLLSREKFRNVISALTSKAVLILGRFTPERRIILEAIADEVRNNKLLPIIFDFERSTARDFTETIKILAGLSLFVIVDITKPKSVPLELQGIVPDYQIPFVPIIQEGEKPFAMFNDLWISYKWMLNPVDYPSPDVLRSMFQEAVLDRAWKKHQELQKAKAEKVEVQSWKNFLSDNVTR